MPLVANRLTNGDAVLVHRSRYTTNYLSRRNYDNHEGSSTGLSSGQTAPLDLSEDGDGFWARRASLAIPQQDLAAYMRRCYLDSSHRYDAIGAEPIEATDTISQFVHIPDHAEDDAEANHAIAFLRSAHPAQIFHPYEQEGLGHVYHCIWCGVADGRARTVDCRYLHYLYTEQRFLRDAEALVLPTLLLEAGLPLPDVNNTDIEMASHGVMDELGFSNHAADAYGPDGEDATSLDYLLCADLFEAIERSHGTLGIANNHIYG